jgi:hypothetical protein
MSQTTETATIEDITADLELLGPIVLLQVQTAPLKQGQRPLSWYDPAPIQAVPALRLDDGGVTGIDGALVADVHHRDHPLTRYRGENGVSIGFTGHYAQMRQRFGQHLVDGIAGESILVRADHIITEADVKHGVVILTANGLVELSEMQSAPPCVEFSKFCAGYSPDQKADRTVTQTLQYLDSGMRGFYATLAAGSPATVTIAVGDQVYRRRG